MTVAPIGIHTALQNRSIVGIARGFVLALLVGVSVCAIAQQQNLKFQHLNSDKGLSQMDVTCVLQDSRGFMWFGTQDGLNKYDGYQFTVYRNDPRNKTSLSANVINDIIEDLEGNLWIATGGGGLNKFQRETGRFVRYRNDINNQHSISSDNVYCLLQDSKGRIWIGTDGRGVDLFDPATQRFIHHAQSKSSLNALADDFVKDIYEDSRRNLWMGTNSGLYLYNPKRGAFAPFQEQRLTISTQSKTSVRVIFEDKKQNLWIGTYGAGLRLLNREKRTFNEFTNDPKNSNSLPNNFITSIRGDDAGNLWIGTENVGISIYDNAKGFFENREHSELDNASLCSSSVNCIYKDLKGDLWIGTYDGGVDFISRESNRFAHYKHNPLGNSLSNNRVLCLYEDSSENFWIGTDGGGVDLFDRKSGKFTYYKHQEGNKNSISGNYVLSVVEDHFHNLWIGTWGAGVTVFNRKTNSFLHFKHDPGDPSSLSENNVWAIFEDSDKNLWIGTHEHGLDLYNPKTKKFSHFRHDEANPESIGSDNILSIMEDRRGDLWIGTNGGGASRWDRETNRFISYVHDDKRNSLSQNSVGCILEDREGNLWMATAWGLNYFDRKDNHFSAFFTEDGLPSDAIQGILEDEKGNLWISTNNGISKFNPKTKSFKNFGISDGLQSYAFAQSYWHSRSGAMYFGGSNGFNEFFADSIKEVRYTPPLVFTDFALFNEPVPIADSLNPGSPLKKDFTETRAITLSYDQSKITFGFASLNFASPERRKYSYMLEGFDKEWTGQTIRNSATYTNLDPAEYTFKVKASDHEGRWSKDSIALTLIITPPYWQTWWFRTSFLLALAASIYSFIRLRVNVVRKQKMNLEEQVRLRTAEVMEQKDALEVQAKYMVSLNEQQYAQTEYLQTLNGELQRQKEETVAEREEAEKARQEAERANQAKSIFLATMSHEIRTPMNGVLGMASLLAETTLTTEQQDYTDTIRSSGDALLTVINDILDFSKIESGKLELDHHSFDLRQCLEQVMDVFSAKAAENGLDLVYQIDYQIPTQIVSDSHRLRQILINLIGNAMKFTQKGEIFVGINLLKLDRNNLELSFNVRDTGIGIPKEKLSGLFQAFSQGDSSTTRKYGGTGLGLVISQRLVELMGGSIEVESQPDQGSSFVFTMKALVSQESIRQYANTSLSGYEGKKVLVVDDNKTNLTILKSQLEHWKLLPTLAYSGAEALQLLAQKKNFDLVITDMQMPDMDGIQLTQQIRSGCPSLPVILLSSIGDESKKKFPGLFSAVLNKPVKQQHFLRTIHAVLSPEGKGILLEEQKPKQLLSEDFARKYPLRILIAEDNPINQKLAIRVLAKLGYQQIDVAQNGLEVIEKLDELFYDVIFMDIQMPELDGLEATRMIRSRHYPQPVIIAMTANAMQGDLEECMKAGMDDYISKPVKLEILVSQLEKWSNTIKQRLAQATVMEEGKTGS